MVAPKGNKFAAKPETDRASVLFNLRISRKEKEQWLAAARAAGKTLARWIRDTLKANSGQGQ